jgi:DNA-binding beta-propeller fold protein YncE
MTASGQSRLISFSPVEDWGMSGALADCVEVADVAVDAADNVYAFARKQSTVFRLDRHGELDTIWDPEPFQRPHAVTVSPLEPALFCVDDYAQAVMKFGLDGTPLMRIDTTLDIDYTGYTRGDSTSVRRAGPPFCYPTSVGFGPEGDLYVSDGYGNARVHHFTADGELISSWGEPGDGPGEFVLPHGVLVVGDRVYVADRENDRVQIFGLDGTFLDAWTDCYRPAQMVRDADGLLYLAELGRVNKAEGTERSLDLGAPTGRVTVREPSGRIVAVINSHGLSDRDQFFAPHGIAMDSHGDIYVSETYVTFFRGQAPTHRPLHKLRRQ